MGCAAGNPNATPNSNQVGARPLARNWREKGDFPLQTAWDGANAEGLGGTCDVVGYAQHKHRPVVHINPFTETVRRI